jgi:hypothetical protein
MLDYKDPFFILDVNAAQSHKAHKVQEEPA